MNIWKIIYLILVVLSCGMIIAKHGQPQTGTYSGWAGAISLILQLGLLALGGFFNP